MPTDTLELILAKLHAIELELAVLREEVDELRERVRECQSESWLGGTE